MIITSRTVVLASEHACVITVRISGCNAKVCCSISHENNHGIIIGLYIETEPYNVHFNIRSNKVRSNKVRLNKVRSNKVRQSRCNRIGH